jgi:osmotically-inducible protein OsmY
MKPRIRLALPALLAAAASLAFAQAPSAPAANYVQEPVASAFKADGPEGELATSVAQDLVAESSLGGSKLAVGADNDTVILTGVTATREQMKKAAAIAAARAGEGKVVNAIQTEEAYTASAQPADQAPR